MSRKNNPRYFETVGSNVLKLIFSFVVWKWKMTTPMEFFSENGTKGKMIHSSGIVTKGKKRINVFEIRRILFLL